MFRFTLALLFSATLLCSLNAQQQVDQAELLKQLDQLRSVVAGVPPYNSLADAGNGVGRSVTIGMASRQTPAEPPPPQYVLRAYDLADLFSIAPDTPAKEWISGHHERILPPAGGGMSGSAAGGMGGMGGGGMGGGMFNVFDSNNAGSATPSDLIDLLQSVVEGKWDSEEETIHQLGGTLVVRATENAQKQIESLLNLLSQRWNSKVVLGTQIDFVYLNNEESKQLQALIEGSSETVFSESDWTKFRDGLAGADRPKSSRARMTGFNGQQLSWTSGHQYRTVADVQMGNKGRLESLNFNYPHTGVACETRATLSHSQPLVTLNISAQLLRDGPSDSLTLVEPLPGVKVDRQSTVGQSIAISTRLPLDKPSLVATGSDTELEGGWTLHVVARVQQVHRP